MNRDALLQSCAQSANSFRTEAHLARNRGAIESLNFTLLCGIGVLLTLVPWYTEGLKWSSFGALGLVMVLQALKIVRADRHARLANESASECNKIGHGILDRVEEAE